MIWLILGSVSLLVAIGVVLLVRRRRSAAVVRAARPRTALAAAAGVAAGLVIAVSTAGATYAYLNAQTAVPGATIRSGTIGLTVGTTTTISNLLPGEYAQQTVAVTATGNAPVSATVRVSTANGMSVMIAQGACGTATTPVTATPTPIGDFTAGQTRNFCVRITAPMSGHAESTSYPVVLTFDSVQKAA